MLSGGGGLKGGRSEALSVRGGGVEQDGQVAESQAGRRIDPAGGGYFTGAAEPVDVKVCHP